MTDRNFDDCTPYYKDYLKCADPNYQINFVFKFGVCENCFHHMMDWKNCAGAGSLEQDQKDKFYKESYYFKKKMSEIKNDIFIYKEKPSWE